MKELYPVFLNIETRRCVVTGGGRVALRKVRTLLKHGANITVISPGLIDGLAHLSDRKKIKWIKRKWSKQSFPADTFLVFAATDCKKTNNDIRIQAHKQNMIVNIADAPDRSDFHIPAYIKRGALKIAFSTSGESPATAQFIRRRMSEIFGDEWKIFLKWMETLRKQLISSGVGMDKKKKIYNELLRSDIILLIRGGKINKARTLFYKITKNNPRHHPGNQE